MQSAHVSLHFAVGMMIGSAFTVPFLIRRWLDRRHLAPGFAYWFAASYGLGVYAVIPSFLRLLHLPESLCSSMVMNVFLLHPLIDRLHPGGMLVGGMLVIAVATSQYVGLLLALAGSRKPV